ncbi:hypothetical protein Rsub_10520 [Raphidocelis subcapitata]|uniref:Uncharacterized protein n=1 Tax=Raphidocelis subcapitata TaxID=307507 RepID=A0A2V0PCR5_9CHLO|nr:hypothetical protein Rsub_10520 [Raphidocelis subcapitata]|eukprot:GBF97644.1 hypothetical protein Rsub_10520 [Raphidocelis subcapitata]
MADAPSASASDADSEADAARALKLLRRLQTENGQLAQNFEELKALHLALAAEHSALRKKHDAQREERAATELQYQKLCESWREELEHKQCQFDATIAQMTPAAELDLLRARMLEEAEAPHRAKCDRLAAEAEAAQEAFALEQRYASELALVRLETDAAEAALAKKLAGHGQLKDRAATLEQQLRAARRAANERASELAAARDEAAALRAAKESAVVEREAAAVRGGRAARQLQGELGEVRALSEGLARKARGLQAELDESTRAQEAMHEQLLSAQAANTSLAEQLASARAAAAREARTGEERAAAAEASWRERIGQLTEECLEKDRRLADAVLREQAAVIAAARDAEARAAATDAHAAEAVRDAAAREAEATARVEAAEAAAAEWQQRALRAERRARADLALAELRTRQQDGEEGRSAGAGGRCQRPRSVSPGAPGGSPDAEAARAWQRRCAEAEAAQRALRREFKAARAEWERRAAEAEAEAAELHEKRQAYRARASALTSELTALRLEAADREASAGGGPQQPPRAGALAALAGAGAGGSVGGVLSSAAAAAAVNSRGELMAAISAMRLRQEAYLAACQ